MCLHPGVFRDNSECPIMDYCSDMDKIVSEVFGSPGDALLFRFAHFLPFPGLYALRSGSTYCLLLVIVGIAPLYAVLCSTRDLPHSVKL